MSIFGGSHYGRDVDRAVQFYEQEAKKNRGELIGREETGRGDIEDALIASQMYGEPYRESGTSALSQYMDSLGIGGSEAQQKARQAFKTSPGYNFALEQGLKSIRRALSGIGLRGSGAEKKELMSFGEGLASKEYANWQDRLSQLAGLGQTSAEAAAQREYGTAPLLSDLGYKYGGLLSDLSQKLGQTRAEGELAKAKHNEESQRMTRGLLGALAGLAIAGPIGGYIGGKVGGKFGSAA